MLYETGLFAKLEESTKRNTMEQNVVLCGANSYDQKYYLNQEFSALPDAVKQELQIMCVWFTEDVGGILTLEFEPDGTLIMKTTADDMDYYYDDIGAGLKLHQLQRQKRELMSSLEMYYRVMFLNKQWKRQEKKFYEDRNSRNFPSCCVRADGGGN